MMTDKTESPVRGYAVGFPYVFDLEKFHSCCEKCLYGALNWLCLFRGKSFGVVEHRSGRVFGVLWGFKV
jgi:hypothetical protein